LSPRKAGTSSATARLTHPGRGHGPCHSARLILGQLWAKAPSQGPPRPRRALAPVGAGCTGPGGCIAQGRGKRGSPFLIAPGGSNPIPRIERIVPAGRRPHCLFSTVPTRADEEGTKGLHDRGRSFPCLTDSRQAALSAALGRCQSPPAIAPACGMVCPRNGGPKATRCGAAS
jgi:hypothetical protein